MYKLLQDINWPGIFIPQGTIGKSEGDKGIIIFETCGFDLEFIKNSPDWFEEVPKWTDDDMLKFGEFVFTEAMGFSAESVSEKVKDMFNDYLK